MRGLIIPCVLPFLNYIWLISIWASWMEEAGGLQWTQLSEFAFTFRGDRDLYTYNCIA